MASQAEALVGAGKPDGVSPLVASSLRMRDGRVDRAPGVATLQSALFATPIRDGTGARRAPPESA